MRFCAENEGMFAQTAICGVGVPAARSLAHSSKSTSVGRSSSTSPWHDIPRHPGPSSRLVAWQVSGTDPEQVKALVESTTTKSMPAPTSSDACRVRVWVMFGQSGTYPTSSSSRFR